MVLSRLRIRPARVGGTAALAAVVAVGLIVAPPQRHQVQVETHQVQLTAAIVGAVQNSAPFDAASSTADSPVGQLLVVPEVAALQAEVSPVLAAAASGDSFLDSPLGTVLLVANLLVLPLWFLATPITLPLSMLIGASQVTMDGSFGGLQFLIATAMTFLTGPLGLLAPFMDSSASAAAAEVSTSGRSGQAGEVASQTAAATSASAAVVDDASPAENDAATTIKRSRGWLVARDAGRGPQAAASVTAVSAGVTEAPVMGDTGRALDEGQAATSQVVEPESAQSDSAAQSSPKSRAKAHARR